MHLNSPWFELVKEGKKIYEGRRNHEKITNIQVGDVIEIKHYILRDEEESYFVKVEEKLYYKTFEDALNTLNINEVLPIENITVNEGIEIYKKYVSIETQIRDGVCMLKISKLNNLVNK